MKRTCPASTSSVRTLACGVGSALLLFGCLGKEPGPQPPAAEKAAEEAASRSLDGLDPHQKEEVFAAVGRNGDVRLLHQAAELAKLGQTAGQIRESLRLMPTVETAPAPQARVRNGERIPESEILRGHVDSGNNR